MSSPTSRADNRGLVHSRLSRAPFLWRSRSFGAGLFSGSQALPPLRPTTETRPDGGRAIPFAVIATHRAGLGRAKGRAKGTAQHNAAWHGTAEQSIGIGHISVTHPHVTPGAVRRSTNYYSGRVTASRRSRTERCVCVSLYVALPCLATDSQQRGHAPTVRYDPPSVLACSASLYNPHTSLSSSSQRARHWAHTLITTRLVRRIQRLFTTFASRLTTRARTIHVDTQSHHEPRVVECSRYSARRSPRRPHAQSPSSLCLPRNRGSGEGSLDSRKWAR